MRTGLRIPSLLALAAGACLAAGCGDDGGAEPPDASDTPPIDAPGNPGDAQTPPGDGAPSDGAPGPDAGPGTGPDAAPGTPPDAGVIQALCPGDPTVQATLLVSRRNDAGTYDLAAYDLDGTFRNALPVTGGSGEPELRDVAADACGNGDVFVYQGTSSPTVAHRTPLSITWSHFDTNGFSTADVVTYGGVAARDSLVYATDMATANPGGAKGVVRFDVGDGTDTRFATNLDPIDLNLGWDGLLYVLHSDGTTVARFDPVTLASRGTVQLDAAVRAVAATADGSIYGASLDGTLRRFGADGSSQQSVASGADGLSDIDIAVDGTVAVGSGSGDVVLTNLALSPVSSFPTYAGASGNTVFVSFVHTTSGGPIGI
jgi:hypothetical protein